MEYREELAIKLAIITMNENIGENEHNVISNRKNGEQVNYVEAIEILHEMIHKEKQQNPEESRNSNTKLYAITDKKIRNEAIINYAVAVLAEVVESAKQEDAPIYVGDEEVDQWVRLSDVRTAINKYLN